MPWSSARRAKTVRDLLRRGVVDPYPHPGLRAREVLQLVPCTQNRKQFQMQPSEIAFRSYGSLVPGGDIGQRPAVKAIEPAKHVEIEPREVVPLPGGQRGNVRHL